jgi:hypothetical protein
MEWWIVGLIFGFFVIRSMWRAYTDPSHVLGRQAANMNWVAIGRVTDSDGYKNVKLARNRLEAIISFQNGNVELVKPPCSTSFKDFIEIERWLASKEENNTHDEEIEYYEAVNDFITSHGFYEPVLELQGTDKEYCIASMKMHKAGYLSGQSEKVVGALTIDSVQQYKQSRQLAIIFLQKLEEDFLEEEENDRSDDETDPDDYHPVLDRLTNETEIFLEENNIYVPLRGNGRAINISSELMVYIASYLAMLNSGDNIAAVSWNSFKSSIENRILVTVENTPSLSESVVTPKGTSFVHYTSEYFTEMTRMEDLILNNKSEWSKTELKPLLRYFLRTLGSNSPDHQSLLQEYLNEVTDIASKEIVPKVVRVFS